MKMTKLIASAMAFLFTGVLLSSVQFYLHNNAVAGNMTPEIGDFYS